MLANGREQHKASRSEHCVDFKPVVKLFTPDAQAVWLLSELFPDDPDVAFGLWALGFVIWVSGFQSLAASTVNKH